YQVEIRKPDSDIWEMANDFPIKGNDFTIDNLQTGKSYEFRVKAKNAAGWGEYTKLDRPVTLKPDSVAPSSPGMLEVKKVGKNHIELAWTSPTDDGGAKITGYIIEKKPIGSDQWVKALPYMSVDNNATITDLPENGEVEFRVKAVNKAGESEPSSTTGPVKITEYPNGRVPTFVKKVTDTNASMNSEAIFTIEYDSNPASEVKWFRNGLELITGGRCRITTNADESKSISTFTETWDSDNNSKISCEIVDLHGRDTCEAVFHVKEMENEYYCRIYGLYNFQNFQDVLLPIENSKTDPYNPTCLSNQSSNIYSRYLTASPGSSLTVLDGSLQSNQIYQFMVYMENRKNSSVQATGYVLVTVDDTHPQLIVIGCVISILYVPNLEYQFVNPITQVALFILCVGTCMNLQNIK
ncbi:unnamed protein product, partial [Adineta steineri]